MAYQLGFSDSNDYVDIPPLPVMSNFDIIMDFSNTGNVQTIIGSNTPSDVESNNSHFRIGVSSTGKVLVLNGTETIESSSSVNGGDIRTVTYSVRNHTGGFSGTAELFLEGAKEGATTSFRGACLANSTITFLGRSVSSDQGARNFTGGSLRRLRVIDYDTPSNSRDYLKLSLIGGNDTTYDEQENSLDGTLQNFPTDDSQWVFYDDGSEPEPVAQPVSLITAEIKNEALTLPISEALSVNLLTGEHATNGYVLNLVSSQVGKATISDERHQASMLTVEQTASQSVISTAAEHRSEAQILTSIQHQRLNSIIAKQVEQALSASLSSIQALTFVVAEEIQNAAPLTVDQYTGQLITLIVAEQREGAQTLLVSQVNKLDLVTAEQASDAQALSIKDLQKIKTIEVEQLTETEILHVLLSGDNTDLTGLRLQPVTPIYSITPIANSYSLNKV
ncbi:hypothetical protein ACE41O_12880 [Alteromonas macleodii]|uniref:hypothetical protein n=1 Tax=Alteromonas macleodii TaxID=28108 RepID=UPI0031401AA2